ncbi:hypothetical protein BDV96DRAFT_565011 [Lophiotrema nucula]|uniref:F-box domain-containing protein n=1 Tax=Lophiotrema nucula TaxID=690887 RepID=A0A6A5ZQJ9_9PLEO|nr:hypothetical protein BDV96DRAFT_565011 [Lophiotrema nucula]
MASSTPAGMPISPLLRLPIELRYTIYGLLCEPSFLYYPYPNSPITSISLQAPPRQLLLICKQVLSEVRSHFYGLATFRFAALGSSKIDRNDLSVGTISALQEVRKAELILSWNLNGKRREAGGIEFWPFSMNGWLVDTVSLLEEYSGNLECVIVTLHDASRFTDWELKRGMLEPLKALKNCGNGEKRVRFEMGQCRLHPDDTRREIEKHLTAYVAELNQRE